MTDVAGTIGRTLAAGGAGFVAGGPLGALVGVATTLVPDLIRSLAGDSAAEVAQQVAGVVQAVAGTDDGIAAAAAFAADPAKALEVKVRLTEIAVAAEAQRRQAELDQLRVVMADAADARAMATASPAMGVAQVRIGYCLLGVFAIVLVGVWLRGIPSGAESVMNILLGMLGGAVMSVVSFFFGGSVGSQEKTGIMANMNASFVRRTPLNAAAPTVVAAAAAAGPRSIYARS